MQKRINLTIVSGLLSFFALAAMAQNGTNSPYTRYGYGELANHSFGAGRSMGGVGIGLRLPKQINPMNPASYSDMDSLTFLFDFGASAQLSWYNDGTNKQNNTNGNVEYMAMQFPLHRRIAMSAGLLPYSHVGYKFRNTMTTDDGQLYQETSTGTGGLNQLYAGLAVDVWKKRLSVGGNIHYLFGSINHLVTASYASSGATSVTTTNEIKFSDVIFDFGAQYTHPLSKTEHIIAGLTYTPKKRLNNDVYKIVLSSETVIDTISRAYENPAGYGLGLSYVKDNKLIIAADFTYQEWGKVAFDGNSNAFKNRTRINAGVEYIPNLFSRPYLNRVRYRAGVNYTNSYIQVNGSGYKEYGATLGFGFPISDTRSFVNVSFEYLNVRPESKVMINENYLRMTLSFTFNEHWFFKRKVE
jgi:hypothetical protein